jgi:hypothetical protein
MLADHQIMKKRGAVRIFIAYLPHDLTLASDIEVC